MAECKRFKGNEDPVSLVCDGTIPQILASGGLIMKAMAMSGESDGPALHKLGETVLGMGFSTATDLLRVKFKVNVSDFKRKKPSGPDLEISNLGELDCAVLTRRKIARIVPTQFDPLGITAPLKVILKANQKELYKLGISWDQPLSGEVRDTWVKILKMLVLTGGVDFRRCTRPVGAVGGCILICYFDGSDQAFAVAVYARWVLENGEVYINLVASKCKVAPMFWTSTHRMELEGATLLVRLVVRVVMALLDDPPVQAYFLGDSESVLQSREKQGGYFGEFFGNRLGEQFDNQERLEEILSVGNNGEWYWVASHDNAADRATRLSSTSADLSLDSGWLEGPAYLKLPVDQWPMNRNFAERKSKSKVPIEEVKKKFKNQIEFILHHTKQNSDGPGSVENEILAKFDYGKCTNNWEKLVRSTSYLFMWFVKMYTPEGLSVGGVARDMAITFWLRVAMPASNKAAAEGKLKHLSPMQHPKYGDMLVVVGRSVRGLRQYFQQEFLPILMASTRVAWLIILWAHNTDHAGVDVTLQTSLQVAWIVGGRIVARALKKSCVRCRYLARTLEGQQMSVLPDYLAVPSPCFTFVAVDLAGPFLCKKEGGSKVTRSNKGTVKVWAVLIVCLQVKAVKIYLAGGLSTEDFLLAWDSFVADHGRPHIAHSDRGSNLVAAAKEGKIFEIPEYDWDSIARSAHGRADWQFYPAGSQFRNGAVEIFVKKFKRTLRHKYGRRLMYLLELQSCFKVIASILNSRPISARWGNRGEDDPDFLSPLTPNMLLTGRANTDIPVRDYNASDNPLYRLQFVEESISQWWDQFAKQNFSSLIPRQKWYSQSRNMSVGDVVLIQYEEKYKPGTYRLGVVYQIQLDPDGLVRTVWVEYSLLSDLPIEMRLSYKGVTTKRKLKFLSNAWF